LASADGVFAAAENAAGTTQLIDALLDARVQLRAQKNWKLSDAIRDRLALLGVQVEDSAGGSSWRWA
jgi:cysteinyl-tRNA synthetase